MLETGYWSEYINLKMPLYAMQTVHLLQAPRFLFRNVEKYTTGKSSQTAKDNMRDADR